MAKELHRENSNGKWNSNRPRKNIREVERILTHQRNGRRTHMQSRIRNGQTRKKTKSELVLANLEMGARERFYVFWRAAKEMTESSMEIYIKGETRGSASASVSSLGERTQRGAHAEERCSAE